MTASPSIYLDNAATTRPLPQVVDQMATAQLELFGNPSSPHAYGPPARRALDDARDFLRGSLGAHRLVFTSGGSEADYLGIVGSAACRPPGRVLMAAADHPAVLRTASLLQRYRHHVQLLPVTRDGDLSPEVLFDALGSDVRVVALLHGHNELGTLCQLDELAELVRRVAPAAHIHVDLVQSYGKLPFTMEDADIDSVAVSGHKFHGPRGAGFLCLAGDAEVAPLQEAGGQEAGLRGGTENVAAAIGMAVAAEYCLSRQAAAAARMEALGELLLQRIAEVLPAVERLGHPERRLPHILSLRLPGITAETLLLQCSERGLAFATGSACHSSQGQASSHGQAKDLRKPASNHVLAAIGLDQRSAREVVRLSFSGQTSRAEVEAAGDILAAELSKLQQRAPRGLAERAGETLRRGGGRT